MARWADYSGGRPSGAALKAAGFSGALRYIGLGSEGKQLSAAEYRDLVATFGASNVLLVAEAGTADAWGTDTDDDYARGLANGRTALADARATGVPDGVGLACAADAHAQAFQVDDVVRYAKGFRDAVGQARCGFYGFAETLAAVHGAGVGSWYWRCGSEPTAAEKTWVHFWQRNSAPTRVTVAGVPCDINEVYRIPTTEEDDMPSLDEIYTKVWYNALWTIKDANGKVTGTPNPSQVLAMLHDQLTSLAAQVSGLTAAVAALSKDNALTPDAVKQIITDAVAQNVRITGSVEITGTNAEAAQ
ncbi:glycoside hydrolase domain-containing protein [Amycolatopsis sp. NPDC049253]|uniref:glycoside hydrolase domain-containing protein n=1 Tax=Amycolatopsis sp. NPDC049253 TaxID=3155274 RepID=UPI00343EF4F4